jgi:general secretion pathway protein G
MFRGTRSEQGFTLIELLVVIAIIAILAGILFPVFARAKRSAKQTVCLSNLKQVGSATALYMSDYDGVFPHALDASDKYAPNIWDPFPEFQARIATMPMLHEALQPYVKSKDVFQCPSDSGTEVLDSHFPQKFPTSPSMFAKYGSSYFFRTEIAFRAFSDATFQLPANVNVYFDGAGHWHGDGRGLREDDDYDTVVRLMRGYRYNCLFGDFHAKSLSKDQMQDAWNTPL